MTTRKQRGHDTQNTVTTYLRRNGFPHAESAGAGRAGVDILGIPGIAVEVKARRAFEPLQWMRQAANTANGEGVPLVCHRPDGAGPASVDNWPVTMRLTDLVQLLHDAGYGDPPENSGGRQ